MAHLAGDALPTVQREHSQDPKQFYIDNHMPDHNTYNGEEGSMLTDRMQIAKAMSQAPSYPQKGECQFPVAMEVVADLIVYITIMKMHHEGKLSQDAAVLLNSMITVRLTPPIHTATHQGISQHNENHFDFENTILRLATVISFFDEGYSESHARHHEFLGSPNDPEIFVQMALKKFGLMQLMELSNNVSASVPGSSWDDKVIKLLREEGLKFMMTDPQYAELGKSLQATWLSPMQSGSVIVRYFGSRQVHYRGTNIQNQSNSYYDTSMRAEKAVDFWTLGEGWHGGHHTKSNVPYTLLSKVGQEVEAAHPEIKERLRGVTGYNEFDGTGDGLPEHLKPEAEEPSLDSWHLHCAVEAGLDKFFITNSGDCFADIVKLYLDKTIRLASSCDMALLRQLHKGLGYQDPEADIIAAKMEKANGPELSDRPPVHGEQGWPSTIWSDEAQQAVRDASTEVRDEVRAVSISVASIFAATGKKLKEREDIKTHLWEIVFSIVRSVVSDSSIAEFLDKLATRLPAPPKGATTDIDMATHFALPLPKAYREPQGPNKGHGERHECLARAGAIVANLHRVFGALQSKL